MKFNTIEKKKEYYSSLHELLKSNKQEKYLSFLPQINKIKQDLFDIHNVENLYIYGKILEKNIYTIDKINILIEMNKGEFEKLVDSHYLDEYKNIDFCILVDNAYYLKEEKWGEKQPIDFKLKL